jgi:hypothetical protein
MMWIILPATNEGFSIHIIELLFPKGKYKVGRDFPVIGKIKHVDIELHNTKFQVLIQAHHHKSTMLHLANHTAELDKDSAVRFTQIISACEYFLVITDTLSEQIIQVFKSFESEYIFALNVNTNY